jgi:glycosyltransferase involved in cell wall biosynthesis
MDDALAAEATRLRTEVADLQVRLAARDAQLSRWRQQYLIVDSLWTCLQQSRGWKWTAPLRALRRWLVPHSFDERALIPWQELQQLGPDTWRSHGCDPQFVVPCLVPAGWVRLQFRLSTGVWGQAELLADYGEGFRASEHLARVVGRGTLDFDGLVFLPRSARGIRFDPLNAPGDFRLETLRIERLPFWSAMRQAWSQQRKQEIENPKKEIRNQKSEIGFLLTERPRVSIIVSCLGRPTRLQGSSGFHLARCVSSIRERTTYADYELVVVCSAEPPQDLTDFLARAGARCLVHTEAANRAALWNHGTAHASGSQFLFLHEDVEILSPEWLEALLEWSLRPEVGAVGARLLRPDGRIQHVGINWSNGVLSYPFQGEMDAPEVSFGESLVPRNCNAVSGACLMTRTEVFRRAGGFNDKIGIYYNDIDYCLRLDERGLRTLCTPHARLRQHGARVRAGVYIQELALLKQRYRDSFSRDAQRSVEL